MADPKNIEDFYGVGYRVREQIINIRPDLATGSLSVPVTQRKGMFAAKIRNLTAVAATATINGSEPIVLPPSGGSTAPVIGIELEGRPWIPRDDKIQIDFAAAGGIVEIQFSVAVVTNT